jgi:hypothetical protein
MLHFRTAIDEFADETVQWGCHGFDEDEHGLGGDCLNRARVWVGISSGSSTVALLCGNFDLARAGGELSYFGGFMVVRQR